MNDFWPTMRDKVMATMVQLSRGRADMIPKYSFHGLVLNLCLAFVRVKADAASILSVLSHFWPSSCGTSDLPQPEDKDS